MRRTRRPGGFLSGALLALVAVTTAHAVPVRHEMRLRCPGVFRPGSRAGLRVEVRGARPDRGLPLVGAEVEIAFAPLVGAPTPVFRGRTDDRGSVAARFGVPPLPDGPARLIIASRSRFGEQRIERRVTLARRVRLLLDGDRRLVQPGQTIRVRAMALDGSTTAALAGRSVQLRILDPVGNVLLDQTATTSAFGIASAALPLSREARPGRYRVELALGPHRATRVVEVRRYVLPPLAVALETDRTSYRPGDAVEVRLQVRDRDGEPLPGAQVTLVGEAFAAGFTPFATRRGETDDAGRLRLRLSLPPHLVGQPDLDGQALVRLRATVTDRLGRRERRGRTLTIARGPLRLDVVAESGALVPGVPNRLLLAAATPDGSPVASRWRVRVVLGGQPRTLVAATDASGVGVLELVPAASDLSRGPARHGMPARPGRGLWLRATVDGGASGRTVQPLWLPARAAGTLLLRPTQALLVAGETLRATCFGGPDGPLHLDAIRDGQLVATTAGVLREGRAELTLSLPADVFGVVELVAYRRADPTAGDRRRIHVRPAQALRVAVEADAAVHRPGAPAELRLRVTDRAGKPVRAAIGLAVVDRAHDEVAGAASALEQVYVALDASLRDVGVALAGARALQARLAEDVRAERRQLAAEALLARSGESTHYAIDIDPEGARRDRLTRLARAVRSAFDRHLVERPFAARGADGWGYRAGLLVELKAAGALPAELRLTDDWDQPLTPEVLARLEPRLAFEAVRARVEAMRVARLLRALLTWGELHPIGQRDGDRVDFRPTLLEALRVGAPLPDAVLTDAVGQRWTLARLQARAPELTWAAAEASLLRRKARRLLAPFLDGARADALRLGSFARIDPRTGALRFDDGLLTACARGRAGRPVASGLTADPAGQPLTLARLSARFAVFAADDLARMLVVSQFRQLYRRFDRQTRGTRRVGGRLPVTPETARVFRTLIAGARDPWGTRLRLELLRGQSAIDPPRPWLSSYQLVSAGPDRRWHTADDWRATHHVEIPSYRAFLAETGRWGRGRAGGKGDDKGGDPLESALTQRLQDHLRRFGGREIEKQQKAAQQAQTRDLNDDEGRTNLLKSPRGPGRHARPGSGPGAGGGALGKAESSRGLTLGYYKRNARAQARLRRLFPETLAYVPELLTDADGRAVHRLRMGDALTRWRVTALASRASGGLGAGELELRVRQPLSVDVELPARLTRGDELGLPVRVRNRLQRPLSVRLIVVPGAGFELLERPERTLSLGPDGAQRVRFRVRARRPGRHTLIVRAVSEAHADAVARVAHVAVDGQPTVRVRQRLPVGTDELTVDVPAGLGSARLSVQAVPDALALLVAAADRLAADPRRGLERACARLAVSAHLVRRLQARSADVVPLARARARLLRAAQAVLGQQASSGGFAPRADGVPTARATAAAALALHASQRAGGPGGPALARARAWLTRSSAGLRDARIAARVIWVQCATGAAPARARARLVQLAEHAQATEPQVLAASALAWHALGRPDEAGKALRALSARGERASEGVEEIALSLLAVLRAGGPRADVDQRLQRLFAARDADGGWGGGLAAQLAFSALAELRTGAGPCALSLTLDGQPVASWQLAPGQPGPRLDVPLTAGSHRLRVVVTAGRPLLQLVEHHVVPWDQVAAPAPQPVSARLAYDRARLATDDILGARLTVLVRGTLPARGLVVSVPLPPGFELLPLAAHPLPGARVEETPSRLRLTLDTLAPGTHVVALRLRARHPLRVAVPAPRVSAVGQPEGSSGPPAELLVD